MEKLTGESIKLNDRSQTSISAAIKALQQNLKIKANTLDIYSEEEVDNLIKELQALIEKNSTKLENLIKGLDSSKQDSELGKGLSTNDFTDELKSKLENLKQGLDGEKGDTGDDGLSAYELAKQEGFNGSLTAWLKSLKGEKGDRGLSGSDGLDGKQGEKGLSAYEIAIKHGFKGTENQWLQSLKGKNGNTIVGSMGVPGASAYQIAVRNGFKGSEKEWLKSLKGSGSGGTSDYNDLDNKPDLSIYSLKTEVTDLIADIETRINGLARGSDLNYIHNQSQPLDTWSITHNLNKYPSVTVIDSAGSTVEGTITYISNEEIKIEFSSPFSGKAILN